MKNKNKFGILSSLITVMFILSLFSGIAAAQTPKEQYEKATEKYEKTKEKYEDTRENFEKAKKDFEKANRQFREGKDNKSKEELIIRTRDYLEKAIDHTVSQLNVLKSRVNNSENKGILPFDASNNIDAHVAQLEQLKTKVEQANTTQEFKDSYQELKELYSNVRLETRYYYEIVLDNRIDNFITKADNVSAKIDTEIQKLKSQGKDTTKLEEMAASFNNLMKDAKDSQQKTSDLFASHNGFSSEGMVTDNKAAETFVKQADNSQKETVKKLKEASKKLLDFVKDFRKESGGKVVVRGTGTLVANGSGRAVIEGNVTVTLSGINGTLKVSSNAEVITDGTGTKEVLGNGDIKYQGFGTATIKGDTIRIEISGNDISLTATGTGSAVLSGKGTYKTEKDFSASGEWKKED
ncbi:MAG: hypothetical protein WA102_04825 [Candidatus Methanoperedens sp.]